jgi:hypothetical protein
MRVHHLVAGLLGLAGLAWAAPTPESAAGELVESVEITELRHADEYDPLPVHKVDPIQRGDIPPTSICSTPSNDKYFLTICTDDGLHRNSIPYEWLDTCVRLSANVGHHVATLVQDPHLMCKFYDDSNECNGNIYKVTKTLETDSFFSVEPGVGNRLMYVMCKKGQWRSDVDEKYGKDIKHVWCYKGDSRRSDIGGIGARDADTTPVDIATLTAPTSKVPVIARVFSGKWQNFAVRDNHAGLCIELDSAISRRVTDMGLIENAFCMFYENRCRANPLLTVKTGAHYVVRPVSSDIGRKITHVFCGHSAGHANIVARAHVTSLEATAQITPTDTTTAASSTNQQPIIAQVFSDCGQSLSILESYVGICIKLNSTLSHHVAHAGVMERGVCRFSEYGCGIDALFVARADDQYVDTPVPVDIGKRITHVVCGNSSGVAEIDARADTTAELNARADAIPTADSATVTPSMARNAPIARIFSSKTSVAIPSKDNKVCIEIESPIAHDVTRVALSDGTVCRLYHVDCNHPPFVLFPIWTVKSDKGYVNSPIPSVIGKHTRWVKCEASTAHPGNNARDEGSSPTAALDTPKDPDESRLEWGQIRGGEDFSGGSTRWVLDALQPCVILPSSLHANSTRFLEQSGRSHCTYYKEDCTEPYLLHVTNTREQDWEVRSDFAQQIHAANCSLLPDSVPPTTGQFFETRDTDIKARDTPPQVTNITITHSRYPKDGYSPTPLLVGDLFICALDQASGCWILHSLNKCLNFPAQIAYNSKLIEQAKGSFCKYYMQLDCMDGDEAWRHTSAPDDGSAFTGPGVQMVNAVWCGGTGATAETGIVARNLPEAAEHTVTNDDHSPATWTPFPLEMGNLFVCAEDQASGCWIVRALIRCITFPPQLAHNAKLIVQAKNSYCKYYQKDGCRDNEEAWQHVTRPDQETTFKVGTKLIGAVWCGLTGVADESDPSSDDAIVAVPNVGAPIYTDNDNEITKRDLPPGSITVCHQLHYQPFTGNSINAIQQCANFAPADQGPLSIIQYGGAYCKWYRDFGCGGGEDKSPKSIDARSGTQWIDNLGREDRFKSVKCETYQW